jgi:hypothetical protein
MTIKKTESAIEDNKGHMHDAWLDAFNLLEHLTATIHNSGLLYVSPAGRVKLNKIIEAGRVAMAHDDFLQAALEAAEKEGEV